MLLLKGKFCHMESAQDDGRSTTVLCHSGQREGETEYLEKWGRGMGWWGAGGVMQG